MLLPTVAVTGSKSLVLGAAGLALFIFASGLQAQDVPRFRAGLWEFRRTIEGLQGSTKPLLTQTQKCTDPTLNYTKPRDMPGCKFSPMTRSGNSYSFTAECSVRGVELRSKSVTTVESDGAYRLTVDSQGGGQQTKEVLVARRIGECKK
jgi:hypothetical protein